jgi:hypothetical protein
MQSLLSDDEIRASVETIQHGRNVIPAHLKAESVEPLILRMEMLKND